MRAGGQISYVSFFLFFRLPGRFLRELSHAECQGSGQVKGTNRRRFPSLDALLIQTSHERVFDVSLN